MPRGGIQKLRDFVVGELGITDPEFNGYGNLIENVITVLQRTNKIQWVPPRQQQHLPITTSELRAIADQIEAYRKLADAGADLDGGSAIRVRGNTFGHIAWTQSDAVFVVTSDADELCWHTTAQLNERFRGPARDWNELEGDRDD